MINFPPIELEYGKSYNYQAYATNSVGVGYGNVLSVNRACQLPPASLSAFVSDDKSITASVTFGGYSTYQSCTTNHKVKLDLVASYDGSIVFQTVTLSASSAGVSYKFNNLEVCRFYQVNASHYSDEVSDLRYINGLVLKTMDRNISFSGPQGSFIDSNTYRVSGSVSGDIIAQGGGANLTIVTIFSSVNPNPNINSYEYLATGTNININSSYFKRGQKNYVRFMAYTDNCQNVFYHSYTTEIYHYSSVHEFTPPVLGTIPTVTNKIDQSLYFNINGKGNVTNDGGVTVTERGVAYSRNPNPTILSSIIKYGAGTGEFSYNISGLLPGKTYYTRTYAINSIGIAYGTNEEISTSIYLASVTLLMNLSPNSATATVNVTDDGGGTVSSRGVTWSTVTTSPQITNSRFITSGSGLGSVDIPISGLIRGTRYYARAFATNEFTTVYSTYQPFIYG